jgi:hypothetical protein
MRRTKKSSLAAVNLIDLCDEICQSAKLKGQPPTPTAIQSSSAPSLPSIVNSL